MLYTSRSSTLHHVTCQLNRCASDTVFSVESEKRRTGKNSEPLPPPSCVKNCKRHYIGVTHCQAFAGSTAYRVQQQTCQSPWRMSPIADYHLRITKPLKHNTKQLVAPPSLPWVELGAGDITSARDECRQI